jgi:hypothetical protein
MCGDDFYRRQWEEALAELVAACEVSGALIACSHPDAHGTAEEQLVRVRAEVRRLHAALGLGTNDPYRDVDPGGDPDDAATAGRSDGDRA